MTRCSFMYILAANATAIDVLSLNAPGQAQNIQTVDIAGPAKASGLIVGEFTQESSMKYLLINELFRCICSGDDHFHKEIKMLSSLVFLIIVVM